MAILNYTTKISVAKTMGEIQELLGSKGALSVSSVYEDGEATAVHFALKVNNQTINFKLPANWQGVLAAFKKDRAVPRSSETEEQAKMTAWRIVKNWVEAQLALIEAGQAEMAEVFLPYATTSSGQTLFQRISNNPQLLLGAA